MDRKGLRDIYLTFIFKFQMNEQQEQINTSDSDVQQNAMRKIERERAPGICYSIRQTVCIITINKIS